jgi:7-cyano-7-deazaguanine reductase
MSNKTLDNSRISKHLGQTSQYKDQYDPELLVREPRANNRTHLDIQDDNLPFVGYDTWNAYEVSALCNNGMPVAGVAKVVYPCDSPSIVESKSIKLYFNSFNMYKCGSTESDVWQFVSKRATDDLSKLLETQVQVCVIPAWMQQTAPPVLDQSAYDTLEQLFTDEQLQLMQFDQYTETPGLLTVGEPIAGAIAYEQRLHSALLKSNCRVTSQPDWGDIYIYIKSQLPVHAESMLKYIVSFRDECHFHEEICETVFKRLSVIFNPLELCVTCLYARRGGIDINPVRASHEHLISKVLIDPTVLHAKTLKQ